MRRVDQVTEQDVDLTVANEREGESEQNNNTKRD